MTEPRQERKVVSVVFCDLVGFTSRAEAMDPEDVAAILRPYHERVRTELERYGGTVEKFIGDAVMALFGAPVAHEDDPERAVRAALAIRDFAVENELELRVGITTGEALVQLDAQPDAGEGMASGDVVNTAARLQSAAPVNGVLVDETTYRATRTAVDYEVAEAVEAKGKAEPVAVWEARTAHSRFGVDVAHEARTELVGRERELGVIRDAFERARHERTPQLLTLVGVPGIGKSRLVYELSRIADADPELVTWRQGRCLAYGDGVTLWALSEIVKAQAGIVEQDTPADVEQKLATLSTTCWQTPVTRSGSSRSCAPSSASRPSRSSGTTAASAAFAAWRRFLEAMAEQRPLVVVFEDLHWADESLLDFVDELVDWVTDVPLLAVATARPELLERRPGWGGGKLNATTLALPPLSEDQTALLMAQLLERSVLPAESQQALLERAGGNPLYAEQFAELFLERGSADELGLPETLQGIIAARLDGLADTEKELLRDAAVIGKVFWASAVRNGSDPSDDPPLARAEGIRAPPETLVRRRRDRVRVCARPRSRRRVWADRPSRPRREAPRGRRVDRGPGASGRPRRDACPPLAVGIRALSCGRRRRQRRGRSCSPGPSRGGRSRRGAQRLPPAEKYYAEAIALWPDDDAERPDLLFRRARSLHVAGDDRRTEALEEARDALLDVDAVEPAAEAEAFLAHGAWYRGRPRRHRTALLAGDVARRGPRSIGVESARARTGCSRADARRGPRAGDRCGTRCPGDRRGARARRAPRARAHHHRQLEVPHRALDRPPGPRAGARDRPGGQLADRGGDTEQPRSPRDLGG